MITIEELKAFMLERPLLTPRGIGLASDVSEGLLGKIMKGDRRLTEDVARKILPVIIKYGYKDKETSPEVNS